MNQFSDQHTTDVLAKQRLEILNIKIDNCLRRVLESKQDSTTIKCSGDVITIKTEGLI